MKRIVFDKNVGAPLEHLQELSDFDHYARLIQPIDFSRLPDVPFGITTKTDVDGVLVNHNRGYKNILLVDAKWEGVTHFTTCGPEFLATQQLLVDSLNHQSGCFAALVVGGHEGMSEEDLFKQRETEPKAVLPPIYSKDVMVRLVYGADGDRSWKQLAEPVSLHEYWLDFCMRVRF